MILKSLNNQLVVKLQEERTQLIKILIFLGCIFLGDAEYSRLYVQGRDQRS